MNGSPSVKVALFIRNGGSESPCRWFYVTGIYNTAVLTNGFTKKTRKTPKNQIELARKYKDDYERRHKNEQV